MKSRNPKTNNHLILICILSNEIKSQNRYLGFCFMIFHILYIHYFERVTCLSITLLEKWYLFMRYNSCCGIRNKYLILLFYIDEID